MYLFRFEMPFGDAILRRGRPGLHEQRKSKRVKTAGSALPARIRINVLLRELSFVSHLFITSRAQPRLQNPRALSVEDSDERSQLAAVSFPQRKKIVS